VVNVEQFGKSFLYIKKGIGPETDPCGTQQEIFFKQDFVFLLITYCFRFRR